MERNLFLCQPSLSVLLCAQDVLRLGRFLGLILLLLLFNNSNFNLLRFIEGGEGRDGVGFAEYSLHLENETIHVRDNRLGLFKDSTLGHS